MSVKDKLLAVQKELKAPKNQYNKFGNFYYRSCEDILEGLKPVLDKVNATLYLTDSIELIGERYYVKATVTFLDNETDETISNSAYARENEDKKGMDSAQVTGATSSYARKYALNGLFLIDDTKDVDTDEYQNQQRNAKSNKSDSKNQKPTEKAPETNTPNVDDPDLVPHGEGMTAKRIARLKKAMELTGKNEKTVLATAGKAESLDKITEANYIAVMNLFLKLMTPEQQKEISEING